MTIYGKPIVDDSADLNPEDRKILFGDSGRYILPDGVVEDLYSAIHLEIRIANLPRLTRWLFGSLKYLKLDDGGRLVFRNAVIREWLTDG